MIYKQTIILIHTVHEVITRASLLKTYNVFPLILKKEPFWGLLGRIMSTSIHSKRLYSGPTGLRRQRNLNMFYELNVHLTPQLSDINRFISEVV